jgi:pimeloyl-ACP methyl ester carboxylesterase
MPSAQVNDSVTIEFDTFGSADDPALLLVMGFTTQMTAWRDDFCKLLADRGLFVIRYDNRVCGLSTKFDGVQVEIAAAVQAALAKQPVTDVPYTLSDMAADGIGVLDHLGIATAHVLGASMGGMIVQTMAIEHADRLRSMTSVMSSIGDLDYGQPDPAAMQVLMTPPPADRDSVIEASTRAAVFCSKRYYDPELSKTFAAAAYDRSFYPEGAPRQMAAIYAGGDRTERLRQVTVPTLVIHGRDDTLISPTGGQRTAELIPTASLLLLADMGHDLPQPLWPVIVDAVVAHVTYAG